MSATTILAQKSKKKTARERVDSLRLSKYATLFLVPCVHCRATVTTAVPYLEHAQRLVERAGVVVVREGVLLQEILADQTRDLEHHLPER